ncbi:MAG: hypothetical protein HOP02_04115 [Methylococcaceae bacterium]|nr:hypothetical protein [Methylococcaceae bacterium]
MNQCSKCGHQRQGDEKKCPQCDLFYSKIDEFLAEEEAKDTQDTLKTRLNRVLSATDRKQALIVELRAIYQAMPKGSLWIMYLVLTFVFALLMMVI